MRSEEVILCVCFARRVRNKAIFAVLYEYNVIKHSIVTNTQGRFIFNVKCQNFRSDKYHV